MTREKGDNVEDGADEKMLATDDKEQLARKDEVKFIASDRSNGDAKIDIGSIEKVCIHEFMIKKNMRATNWCCIKWFDVLFFLSLLIISY